jgi:hypothetical protein
MSHQHPPVCYATLIALIRVLYEAASATGAPQKACGASRETLAGTWRDNRNKENHATW